MNHLNESLQDKDCHLSESEEMDTREDDNGQNQNEGSGGDDGYLNGEMQNGGSQGNQDEPMEEEDEARSEATFRYILPNYSKLRDTALSPPTFVRNLPWKIMIMPRTNPGSDRQPSRSLGFFLQCNGDSESSTWSCNAYADLRIIGQEEGVENFTRRIQHLYYDKENDWGFSHFMPWNEVLDPERGYIKEDTIIFEVTVTADAPHGVSWDSKKHTGFVGLKNPGATCYMNSLLQTLFFTNKLRKAVYQIPTESEDSSESVALALQRVFYELQFSDRPVGTKKLPKSFGWETPNSFRQHSVQELCRVLLDNVESKMKGSCVEGTIPQLFEGKKMTFLQCISVEYTSKRVEPFYDIQLNVKGKKNIIESFKDYTAVEMLEGENKYYAGEHGLQDAERGSIFSSFPPVLHLHLLRFQYDPVTDQKFKINDTFEFLEKLDLEEFLLEPEETPAMYTLHAVLVHSGDNHRGRYVVFINPKGDGRWYKFDDDVVSRCSKHEAIDHNFGGHEDDITVKHCTNAYMLVYIRDSALADVLQSQDEHDIPKQLLDRLLEEKRQETLRRKEQREEHLHMNVQMVTSEDFCGHQGTDLYDPEKVNYRTFKVKKQLTIQQLTETIAKQMNYSINKIRLWPMVSRTNQTWRPIVLDLEADFPRSIVDVSDGDNPWTIFVETLDPDSSSESLPDFDIESNVLFFFKRYDPKNKKMFYCGHAYMHMSAKVKELLPLLNKRAGFPENTELMLYEEVKPTMIERIENLELPIEKVLDELMDGDIIVFQRGDINLSDCELPTVKDYFRDLFNRTKVTFCDKCIPTDPGFKMELSSKMTYDQVANAVAQRLNVDPRHLQFFKSLSRCDAAGNAIQCTFKGTLKDMILARPGNKPGKVYYQQLKKKVNELEDKKQFKCTWVNSKLKEEKELVLYTSKSGCVMDLLKEAKKQVELAENGSGRLRLLETVSYKIVSGQREDTPLDTLGNVNTKEFRIEEIPKEELDMSDDELLVPIGHFHKEVFSTFGVPFLLKLKHREVFSKVKERIQKRLDVPDEEFKKFKFAVVIMGKPQYISEDADYFINLPDFFPATQPDGNVQPRPWLGLQHVNTAPKRSRYN